MSTYDKPISVVLSPSVNPSDSLIGFANQSSPTYDKSVDLAIEFMDNVIIGTERAMYRTFRLNPSTLSILRSQVSTQMSVKLIMVYFNKGYRAFIYSANGPMKRSEDNDPYFYSSLSKLTEVNKHSFICLLNI